MEKTRHDKDVVVPHSQFKFPLKNETPSDANKNVKIFGSIEEAFDAFDRLEEHDGRMEFMLKPTTITSELPPIPTEDEIQSHLMRNALLLVDSGEYGLARNVLGDVLKRNNNHADAIRWMGWCFKQEGDFENASKCYEQLIEIRVTDQDLFEMGEIHYTLHRDKEALGTWLDALGQCEEQSPRLFDLHKNLGNVYTRLGDFESAEENYNKALLLRPHSDVLQVNLGSLNVQKQFNRIALEHFKRAVEINPFNDKGWCGVALVAREMQDEDWAQAAILKALDINPYNLTALQLLVNWAQVDRKWSDAVARVQCYVDKFQNDGDMLYSLAGLHFQCGDLDSSEFELTRLEALDHARGDVKELRTLIHKKRAEI